MFTSDEGPRFIISRGLKRPTFFCFFVDHNKEAWSRYERNAHQFLSEVTAREYIRRIESRRKDRKD